MSYRTLKLYSKRSDTNILKQINNTKAAYSAREQNKFHEFNECTFMNKIYSILLVCNLHDLHIHWLLTYPWYLYKFRPGYGYK